MNSHLVDWQQVAALAIVAVAAFFVLKRLWGQMMAFRSRPMRRKPSTTAPAKPQPPRPQPLVQIQLTPPRHMKRPPSGD
jgi:hypothetical protein